MSDVWLVLELARKIISVMKGRPKRTLRTLAPILGGQSALIELGVTSGLSLVFALLQQNWSNQQPEGVKSKKQPVLLCNQVLQTALEVLVNLEPLSLSSNADAKPKSVAEKSLNQVTEFLQACSFPAATYGDVNGSQVLQLQ